MLVKRQLFYPFPRNSRQCIALSVLTTSVCGIYCSPLYAQEASVNSAISVPDKQQNIPVIPLKNVQVSGNRVIRSEAITRTALSIAGSQPVDRDVITKIVQAVVALYHNKGYVLAQIIEAEPTADGVLHLTITEGVIHQIIIRGNTRTRARTIEQVLSSHPGDVYNEGQVRRDRERLGRLGIFADVSVAPQVPGTPEEPDPLSEGKIRRIA